LFRLKVPLLVRQGRSKEFRHEPVTSLHITPHHPHGMQFTFEQSPSKEVIQHTF
jgi:hypothetical protein